jgi:hypothetical protein
VIFLFAAPFSQKWVSVGICHFRNGAQFGLVVQVAPLVMCRLPQGFWFVSQISHLVTISKYMCLPNNLAHRVFTTSSGYNVSSYSSYTAQCLGVRTNTKCMQILLYKEVSCITKKKKGVQHKFDVQCLAMPLTLVMKAISSRC